MRHAIIDGDILVYRCGFAAQHTHYDLFLDTGEATSFPSKKELNAFIGEYKENNGEGGLTVETRLEVEPVENALSNTRNVIESILSAVKAGGHTLYITGEGNFREELATIAPYKGNRDKLHKPVHYDAIRDYLVNQWDAIIIDGMEADDAIGIHACSHSEPSLDYIICSIDKDLDMIPGLHYNFVKQEEYTINEEEAEKNFYLQLLQGDPTDNIKGIHGVGPKSAEKLLSDLRPDETRIGRVLRAYKEAFKELSHEEVLSRLLEVGQLLWIWRKENDLWTLPEQI